MIGTDYSHTDISANLGAFGGVQSWIDEGRISNEQAEKLLDGNAREFYGL